MTRDPASHSIRCIFSVCVLSALFFLIENLLLAWALPFGIGALPHGADPPGGLAWIVLSVPAVLLSAAIAAAYLWKVSGDLPCGAPPCSFRAALLCVFRMLAALLALGLAFALAVGLCASLAYWLLQQVIGAQALRQGILVGISICALALAPLMFNTVFLFAVCDGKLRRGPVRGKAQSPMQAALHGLGRFAALLGKGLSPGLKRYATLRFLLWHWLSLSFPHAPDGSRGFCPVLSFRGSSGWLCSLRRQACSSRRHSASARARRGS
jgi:hypothetical protein